MIKIGENKMTKKRKSATSLTLNPNVRCNKVYPTAESKIEKLSDLKTIAIKLTPDQATHLARVLLAASQEWHEIDLTVFRFERRKADNTYQLTITSDKY